MFESKCVVNKTSEKCESKRCLFPQICKNLILGHNQQLGLLKKIGVLPNVKKVFFSSGTRYDMVCSDDQYGQDILICS
ncbi:hypothetical protein AGMMS49921_00490 [Endomicrobiia bacterium]|nr:hypothetical protein AGMMS49921_00490 [Endomicrobiia bacterium]